VISDYATAYDTMTDDRQGPPQGVPGHPEGRGGAQGQVGQEAPVGPARQEGGAVLPDREQAGPAGEAGRRPRGAAGAV